MFRVKQIHLKSTLYNLLPKKPFDLVRNNILNLYGLGMGITSNYYIYNTAIKNSNRKVV